MPRIQAKSAHNEDFFSDEQLIHFGKELRLAGSFDALMIEKQAARYNAKNQFIVLRYSDIDSYITQHLVGVYAGAVFHTDVPYRFWEQMLREWRERCQKKLRDIY